MATKSDMLNEFQRYYALWKESNAVYEEWAKLQGLSINSLLILYSFYDEESYTQKTISKKWCIPKQTVNTILKDFESQGYVELLSMPHDKRNKQICLTPAGKLFVDKIIAKLQEKELYVMKQMGIEHIKSMNDEQEQFIKLFRAGGLEKNE